MDSITQFLLGAGVASIALGPRLGWRAALVGGVTATLPDLDSFIPFASPLDAMTHHRGFSHSVFVQTLISPVLALGIKRLFAKTELPYPLLLLTVWLCLVTHSLLDCLTTYGTQIFWPLNVGPPVALPSIFIIDPFYSLLLLIGVIGFVVLARGRLRSARRFMAVFMALASSYLLAGVTGHHLVKARAEAMPALAGMRVHVQPTPFNIFYWQVLAVNDRHIYTGLTSLYSGCPLIDLQGVKRTTSPAAMVQRVPADVKRFEWFTDGFFDYRVEGEKLMISDLRIGFHPVYPFTFQFAENGGDGWRQMAVQRVRGAGRGFSYLKTLYTKAQSTPPGCGQ